MAKLIALKSGNHEMLHDAWHSDFSNLKQQALFFDQIGIYKLSNFYKSLRESTELLNKFAPSFSQHKAETIITELEWLQQKNIIFELRLEEELSDTNSKFLQSRGGQKFEDAKKLLKRIVEFPPSELRSIEDQAHRLDLLKAQHFAILRLMSIFMEAARGITAVTTFPYFEYAAELPNSSKSDVAQVVISKLPMPDNETPWEQIIDYRDDEDNQKNLLNLRRWITKISTENLSSVEIEEELEWLLNKFKDHMKIHNLKANTETLELVVKILPETIENLIKLRFSKLPEPFFALKKRQINLMEAELNAPGREMSYVIKIREAFPPHK
jgi:hypothetical protein